MSRTNIDRTLTTPVVNITRYTEQTTPSVTHPDGSTTPPQYRWVTVVDDRTSYKTRRTARGSAVTPGYGSRNQPNPLPENRYSFTSDQLKQSSYYSSDNQPGTSLQIPRITIITEEPTARYNGYSDRWDLIPWGPLYDACTTKLRNRIRDSSVNLAQAFAERKQTANTIASTANMIARAGMAVKRGDMMGAARALGVKPSRSIQRRSKAGIISDSVANRWLEVQYGWKPLLSDVYGSMEQLAKSNDNRLFRTATASIRGSFPYEETTDLMDYLSNVGYNVRRQKDTQDLVIKMKVRYEISSPPVATMVQLGITNPALLAWELLPFSFVADWFLPVGNFLSSLDATLGLTFKTGYSSDFRRMQTHVHHDAKFSPKSTPQRQIYIRGINITETIRYERYPMTDFPSARLPHFKNPVSTVHAANALALLIQTFKR